MAHLPSVVEDAWEGRQGPIVLVTVDAQGMPNAIYATCVRLFDASRLVVADNYFSKTRANLLAGTKGSVLFITDEGKAYQIKGTLERQTSGEVYDDMKRWLDPKYPGHAATVLHVEQVYSGGTQLL
jgi:hypothetical protein